jgi:O-antigen ligase
MDRTVGPGQRIVQIGLLGLIVFSPLPAASVPDWSVLVIQLLVLVLTAAAFISAEREPPDLQQKSRLKGVRYLFVGLWGFVLIQCLPLPKFLVHWFSPGTYSFFERYLPDFSRMHFASFSLAPAISLKSALALLPYFLTGFLIVKTIKKRSQILLLFSALFLMGVFEAVYGLLDYFRGSPIVSGTFINRNHFAGYLEMVIPVGLGLMLVREGRGKRAFAKSLVFASGVVIMSLALLLSRSRSGMVILAIVFFLFFFFHFWYKKRAKEQKRGGKILLVSVVIIILILSLYIGVGSTLQRFSRDSILREGRLGIWVHTWKIFTDFPLFGSGLGTFAVLGPVTEADGQLIKTSHAHNDYLEFLSELGVVGMGMLSGGVIYLLVLCFREWRKKEDALMKGLGFGGLVSVLSMSLHGLTDFNLHIPANILLFSVVLSLSYVTVTHRPSREE